MDKTIACVITYNDFPLIKDCIKSVQDKVDKIVVIDGKFKDFPGYSTDEMIKDFPGHSHFSTDGTLQYLKDKVSLTLIDGFDEIEKRNYYFNYLRDGDICLNIDSDEVLIGDIPKLMADIGIIQIGEQGDSKRHRRTIRFFKYQKGLHYWGKHSLILDNRNKVFAHLDKVGEDYTSQKITEFEFLHNNHRRDYNRIKNKKIYYEILMKREAKINGANFS